MHVVGEHAGDDGLALAGRGLRDTTRLAASPPDIWRDIAATNATTSRAALDDADRTLLATMRDDLERGAAPSTRSSTLRPLEARSLDSDGRR